MNDLEYSTYLESVVNTLTDEINELDEENRRMRWYLNRRIEGTSLLEDYDSINPKWIDAMMNGCKHEMPPYQKEEFLNETVEF